MRARKIWDYVRGGEADCAIIACSILAGDMFVLVSPSGSHIVIDAGYHRDENLLSEISSLPGKIEKIIITHQHVDHFGSLKVLQDRIGLNSTNILHSGIALPPGYLPPYSLSTCNYYLNDIEALWLGYHDAVGLSGCMGERWSEWSTGGIRVRNLFPEMPFSVADKIRIDPSKVDLNRATTPVEIIYEGNTLAVLASDINAGDYNRVLDRCCGTPSLLAPASHGRPQSNPKEAMHTLNPDHIFISDHFPDSDFRFYYKESVGDHADIRSANVDGHQIYFFLNGKIIRRELLHVTEAMVLAE